jgi:ATP-dependent DNA ligase
MELPVRPPVAPMLARLARELPTGSDYVYEPKWDGFRCLIFRSNDEVDMRSRNDRPFARYFPEVVIALRALPEPYVVLDGELLVTRGGAYDFSALLARLHPARARVDRLAAETPAMYVVFDVLAVGGRDLRDEPYAKRRTVMERLAHDLPPGLVLTPATPDAGAAARWLEGGAGVDGVVAKRTDLTYRPGERAMVKVKRERTAECVVAGFRVFADGAVASLLLGVYDDGNLHHVGVVSQLAEEQRQTLFECLWPLATSLYGHPWRYGFGLEGGTLGRLKGVAGRWTPDMQLDWVPVRPVAVCEVAYDHMDSLRFRHPARLIRWRPDRDPRSCTVDQFNVTQVRQP